MKLPVNIKRKQANLPVYTIVSLVMLCIALFCLFIPFIPVFRDAIEKSTQTAYMILGGVGTMFFAFFTSYTVFNIISPPIGVVVSEEGVYEYTVAGCGAGFIPKEAIVSLKTFGKDKKQYLGIGVASEYIDSLGEGAEAQKEIKSNISAGIPAVIIRQKDIYIPISELFKMIKNAYSTEDKPQKVITESAKETDKLDSFSLLFGDEKAPEKEVDTDGLDLLTALRQQEEKAKAEEAKKKEQAAETKAAETKAPEVKTAETMSKTPPANVIRTVDELLAQLNIPSKPRKSDSGEE